MWSCFQVLKTKIHFTQCAALVRKKKLQKPLKTKCLLFVMSVRLSSSVTGHLWFFGLQMLLLSIKARLIFVISLNASHVNNVSYFFFNLFFKDHVLKYFSALWKAFTLWEHVNVSNIIKLPTMEHTIKIVWRKQVWLFPIFIWISPGYPCKF